MLKTLKKFFGFLFLWKNAFLAFLITGIIASILANLPPYLYQLLVDTIPTKNYSALLEIVFIFAGLKILSNILFAWNHYLGDKAAIPCAMHIREKIFHHVQELDFAFHANKTTGSLIGAFKRGNQAFWSLFSDLSEIMEIIVGFFVIFFFFSQLSVWFLVIAWLFISANITASYFLIKVNVKKRRAVNEMDDKVSGVTADNFLNYETVKYFTGEKRERARLKNGLNELTNRTWAYANSFRLMDIIVGTLSGLGMFCTLWFALIQLQKGEITSGSVIMIASFSTSLYYQFFHLLYESRNIAKTFTDLKRYFGLLDIVSEIKDPIHPKKIENLAGEIVFKDVVFDYPKGKKDALRNFCLKIAPGEIIAFVGKSGAGKTTFAKLLFRFYNLKKGKILIDGVDIKEMATKDLRKIIGIVPQEPMLFNHTIKFNIAFGAEKPTQKDIEKAAKMANIYDFIQTLPKKYNTRVGERGVKLSGGQKQRLAIARMLMAGPKIIVFDEATSQLDSESEKLIQEALWRVAKNRTVLIIAHRFSTLNKANRIIVLEDGRIAEQGSHKELIKKAGIYKRLWTIQSSSQTLI